MNLMRHTAENPITGNSALFSGNCACISTNQWGQFKPSARNRSERIIEDRVMPSSFLIRAQIRCHKDLNLKVS